MSASAATLTTDEYEERKAFLQEIKLLVRDELEDIYRILKKSKAEFSENSNGVFFDVCKVSAETFDEMKKYITFSKGNRTEFAQREEEQRKAREALRNEG